MRAEELTTKFGIAGILDFVETEHGLVKVVISLDGMAGEVYLQGAQLTAWQPPGERPVLIACLRRVGQFAAASPSYSRGSAPVGTPRRRRSTALRVPRHGSSTEWKPPAASR